MAILTQPILRLEQDYDIGKDKLVTRITFGWAVRWLKYVDLPPVSTETQVTNKDLAIALHIVAKELENTPT